VVLVIVSGIEKKTVEALQAGSRTPSYAESSYHPRRPWRYSVEDEETQLVSGAGDEVPHPDLASEVDVPLDVALVIVEVR